MTLRKLETVTVRSQGAPFFFSKSHRVFLRVGKKEIEGNNRWTLEQLELAKLTSSKEPVCYIRGRTKSYWRYKESWFLENDGLDDESVRAIIIERELRTNRKIQRAKTIAGSGQLPEVVSRSGIPEQIRMIVWQRDGGACQRCGSKSELQFDHIIPISMGGATSEENLQILCGPCNRRKGASVG